MIAAIHRSQQRRSHGLSGYTLIELLIVVAIIGILAAIAIPQFGQYRARAIRGNMTADARNIASLMHVMFTDLQTYASAQAGGPGPTSFDLDGGGNGYIITLSRNNTLAFPVLTPGTFSLTITNPAGDGSGFQGPVMFTSAGVCTWASSQNC